MGTEAAPESACGVLRAGREGTAEEGGAHGQPPDSLRGEILLSGAEEAGLEKVMKRPVQEEVQ